MEQGYYYQQLSGRQRECYLALRDACADFQQECVFHDADIDTVIVAVGALSMDHPEFYWTDHRSYQYSSEEVTVTFPNLSPETARNDLMRIEDLTRDVVAAARQLSSSYDKVQYLHDWILDHLTYTFGKNDQNIVGGILWGKAVCAGYARTFQYLCQQVQIPCAYVIGEASGDWGDDHSWNLIQLDGTYYWADVTWDDTTTEKQDPDAPDKYMYLCTTDEFLFRSHRLIPFSVVREGRTLFTASYPSCRDESLLCIYRYGRMFDAYDEEAVVQYILSCLRQGKTEAILLQFRDVDGMRRCIDELFPHIFDRIWADGMTQYSRYSYTHRDQLGFLSLSVFTE